MTLSLKILSGLYLGNQCPYQLSTSYTLWFQRYCPDKILKVKVTTERSNQGHTMTVHTYNPQPMSLPSINFLHRTLSEIQPKQDFIGQGHYSKVKGQIKVTPWRCTPTPPTNILTKYQLPTPYSFRDIARTRFYRSRSLRQGQRSNQGHTMTLHTYTP